MVILPMNRMSFIAYSFFVYIFLLTATLSYAQVSDSDQDGVPDCDGTNVNLCDLCPGSQTVIDQQTVDQQGCTCEQKSSVDCPTRYSGAYCCPSSDNLCVRYCSSGASARPECRETQVNVIGPCAGGYCLAGTCVQAPGPEPPKELHATIPDFTNTDCSPSDPCPTGKACLNGVCANPLLTLSSFYLSNGDNVVVSLSNATPNSQILLSVEDRDTLVVNRAQTQDTTNENGKWTTTVHVNDYKAGYYKIWAEIGVSRSNDFYFSILPPILLVNDASSATVHNLDTVKLSLTGATALAEIRYDVTKDGSPLATNQVLGNADQNGMWSFVFQLTQDAGHYGLTVRVPNGQSSVDVTVI